MNKTETEQEKPWKHVVREQIPFGLGVLLTGMAVLWGITCLIPLPGDVGTSLGLFEPSWYSIANWILIIWTFGVTGLFVAGNLSDCRGDDWCRRDFLNNTIIVFGMVAGLGAAWLTSWHVTRRPDFALAAFNGNLREYIEFTRSYPVGETFVVNGEGEYRTGRNVTVSTKCYSLSGSGKFRGKIVLVPTENYSGSVTLGSKVTLKVDPPQLENPLFYNPTPSFVLQSE